MTSKPRKALWLSLVLWLGVGLACRQVLNVGEQPPVPDAQALTAAALSLVQTQVALEQTVQAIQQPAAGPTTAAAPPVTSSPSPATSLPPTSPGAALPTATPAPVASPSPTPEPKTAGVPAQARGNLYCRTGPAPYYPAVTLVERGSSVTVVGRNRMDAPDYWLVRLDDGTVCWVWGRWLQVQGEVVGLPIPTAPPPPPGAFSLGLRKVATCGGQYALVFVVTNRGPETLESIHIKVKIRESGGVYEIPPAQRNQFVRCSGAKDDLPPGRSTEVWVLTAAENPSGKTLEVWARACTGDDFSQDCVERTPFIVQAP